MKNISICSNCRELKSTIEIEKLECPEILPENEYNHELESISATEYLAEIKEKMLHLLDNAEEVIHQAEGINFGPIWERAKGYWFAHIRMALDNTHSYLGKEMVTMANTISDLDEGEENED